MVPRSFRYTAAPPMESLDEKDVRMRPRKSLPTKSRITSIPRPLSPVRTVTEPTRMPTQPVSVPKPERTVKAEATSMPAVNRSANATGRKTSKHDPNALPPAVAALLAVTEIPRPRRNQFQRRSAKPRRISLDELVHEWKNDESLKSTYGSSPALSVLLEDPDSGDAPLPASAQSVPEESFLYTRSVSADSVPSLEADDISILSNESLSTPESLRSRKSSSNLRKQASRSLPTAEECVLDHPLAETPTLDEDPDDGLILSPANLSRSTTPKPKSSFKSNLTSSLQALKNAAISSISSLTNTTTPQQRTQASPMPDNVLWSHPFLFPRFSSEVRPAITGTPTEARRRYFNPAPLTFEEQEAPFQLALHAPFLAEPTESAPTIQLQTYGRARRKSAMKRGLDPHSEAGMALLGVGVRQREVRENSDFLRVYVIETNMQRCGKLKGSRAKIALPPRQVGQSMTEQMCEKVPRRWVGESAY